jgi:hypothetical protein
MRLCNAQTRSQLSALLARYRLRLEWVEDGSPIPGSFWGAPEAGVVGDAVHVGADTPLHSALHETAHVICMDSDRRAQLHTDAGGDHAEENAVCYLQIVLARELGVSERAICADMDAWGYTFRLGSAYAWYTADAEDARAWLMHHGLITPQGAPTSRRRGKVPVATSGLSSIEDRLLDAGASQAKTRRPKRDTP